MLTHLHVLRVDGRPLTEAEPIQRRTGQALCLPLIGGRNDFKQTSPVRSSEQQREERFREIAGRSTVLGNDVVVQRLDVSSVSALVERAGKVWEASSFGDDESMQTNELIGLDAVDDASCKREEVLTVGK